MSKTVLIVDDDKLARKSLASLLINAGLAVTEAENGKTGLEEALKGKPDIVVTDVHMPEISGLEMVEKLREDEWGKDVPVIVLTVDEALSSINQALAAGVTIYLTKSGVDAESLASQVVTAVGGA